MNLKKVNKMLIDFLVLGLIPLLSISHYTLGNSLLFFFF